jgi:hypothetical protein
MADGAGLDAGEHPGGHRGLVQIPFPVTGGERSMDQPKVSIIMLNWNGLADTVECLESLKKITYPNYEVIVVDNASEGDDTKVLEEKFGGYIHLMKNDQNYGFCVANNRAIRYALEHARPDYFLLLNNDTVVDPAFLTEMVKTAEADPAVAVAGAKFYYYDDPNRLQSLWGKTNLWKGNIAAIPLAMETGLFVRGHKEYDRGQYDALKEVSHVPFWCVLIRRTSMEAIGLLDERYFLGWDEVDYATRTRKAGFKIAYVPAAKVWHKYRTAGAISGQVRRHGIKGLFHLARRHATRGQYCCLAAYVLTVHLALITGYYLVWQRRPDVLLEYYRGIRDGLLNRP